MKLNVIKLDGGKAGSIDLDDALFGLDPRADILHRVVRWQRNNAQAGTHSTLGRSEVKYSTKKIYRQKGLGVGRAGDKNAIQRRGGGVAFGPKPRSYNQKLNKKIKRLAMERALIDQAQSNTIYLIESWSVSEPKTTQFKSLIGTIAPDAKKVLAIGDAFEDNFALAARNLSSARLGRAQDLSPLDIVQCDRIVVSLKGLDILLAKFGKEEVK